jgi:hypothetical protein
MLDTDVDILRMAGRSEVVEMMDMMDMMDTVLDG